MKETREMSFLLEDAATRYARFQEEYPGIQDSVKQYHVASFLGITPEGLSRIRKKNEKILKINLDQCKSFSIRVP
jgi:hypothetical protein